MKVLIGIPSFDMLHTDFCMSLAAMLTKRAYDRALRRDIDVALYNVKCTMIAHARNMCVTRAREVGATHLMFLDSDMTFPADTLTRLAAHHVPIVGADYPRRAPPHGLNGLPRPDAPREGNGLVPMLTLPFGCILIKMGVFNKLSAPVFRYLEGVTDSDTMSEDTGFCNDARRAGFDILMDPTLTREVGHIGQRIYNFRDASPQQGPST